MTAQQLSKILFAVFISLVFIAGCAKAEILVFIEAGVIKGIEKTAAEIGSIHNLAESASIGKTGDIIIVAGRFGSSYITPIAETSRLEVQKDELGKQGFYIKTLENGTILITANTDTGILYGLMELRDRIEEDGQQILKEKFDYKDRPIFEVRIGDVKRRANFTTFWADERTTPLYSYEDSPEIFGNDEVFRRQYIEKVKANREKLKRAISDAQAYGAKTYLFMFQPTLPPKMHENFIAAHPEVKFARQEKEWHPFICPSNQVSKDLLYMKMRDLFRDVSGINGLVLCFGEGWQSIFSCGCQKCESQPYEQRLIEYLMLIRKAIHESTPDAIIYLRPWQIVDHGFDGDSKKFTVLSGKLPEDIRFWSKITVPPGGDYLWNDQFNPYIKMPRMETFGWHIYHPNMNQPCVAQLCYTAPKLKARAVKLAALGLKGQSQCQSPDDDNDLLYEPSRLAGLKIAWNPYRFDSNEFLLKWAQRRFGEEAGVHVAAALKDTYRITDAFTILPTNTNWFHMLNFVKGKKTHCYSRGMAAQQNKEVADVTEGTIETVLSKFRLAEEIRIAEDAEKNLTKAMPLKPEDNVLKRFWMMGKATAALTRFYHNYHFALIYNNVSETAGARSQAYHKLAVQHIEKAVPDMEAYIDWMHKIHPEFSGYFEKIETSWTGNTFPKFVPYIFGQLATVSQQCWNGYNRIVMESLRSEKFPYLLLELQNPHKKIGYKRYAPWPWEMKWENIYPELLRKWKGDEFVLDLAGNSQDLPAVLSPWILPKLRIKFQADLSGGAMLVLRYVPLGGKARSDAESEESMRKSILKLSLDDKPVKTLIDIATDDTIEDSEFIRYVQLLPVQVLPDTAVHELSIESLPGCTGAELYSARIYTRVPQKIYIQNPDTTSPYDREKAAGSTLWGYEY
ncbi:MAG: hypothetical protein PHF37_01435 [Phycisphaerae bacterium]|nr:hypothetical protein [Phycisphaerae bacterium]